MLFELILKLIQQFLTDCVSDCFDLFYNFKKKDSVFLKSQQIFGTTEQMKFLHRNVPLTTPQIRVKLKRVFLPQ